VVEAAAGLVPAHSSSIEEWQRGVEMFSAVSLLKAFDGALSSRSAKFLIFCDPRIIA